MRARRRRPPGQFRRLAEHLLGQRPDRRRPEPLLELRFFRSHPFTGASVIAVLAFLVLGGFLFVITLYLQQVRGHSPLRAGLSLLPAMIMMALAAPVAGQVSGRYGARVPLVASGLLIAAGMAMLLGLGPVTPDAWVFVSLTTTARAHATAAAVAVAPAAHPR